MYELAEIVSRPLDTCESDVGAPAEPRAGHVVEPPTPTAAVAEAAESLPVSQESFPLAQVTPLNGRRSLPARERGTPLPTGLAGLEST